MWVLPQWERSVSSKTSPYFQMGSSFHLPAFPIPPPHADSPCTPRPTVRPGLQMAVIVLSELVQERAPGLQASGRGLAGLPWSPAHSPSSPAWPGAKCVQPTAVCASAGGREVFKGPLQTCCPARGDPHKEQRPSCCAQHCHLLPGSYLGHSGLGLRGKVPGPMWGQQTGLGSGLCPVFSSPLLYCLPHTLP